MKNLKYILGVSLSALLLASCENFFDEKQLHNDYTITDTKTRAYTMTAKDYKSVVANAANIAKAKEQCTETDSTAYHAFLRIAAEQAFNELATADMYVPAFINGLYPQLSKNSLVKITCNTNYGTDTYLAELSKTEQYNLTADNYKTIWEKEGIEYLTPKTVGNLASVLPMDKDSGAILAVTYDFKNYEPATGGSEEEEKGFYWGTPEKRGYYSPSEVVEAYTVGTLKDGDSIKVGGVLSKWYSKSYSETYKNLSYYISDGINEFEMYNSFSLNKDSIRAFEYVSETKATATDMSGRTFTNGDTIIGFGAFTYFEKYNVYEFQKGCYIIELRPVKKTNAAPRKAQMQADGKVSVLYQFNGTSWNVYKQSEVTIDVLPQSVYSAVGVNYISDNGVLTKYLQTTYPYAPKDSKFTVVYKVKDGFTATEYVYNGTDFVENTGIVEETLIFSLQENWNLAIFYKQAIAGEADQGELQIQDIELDGLNYVWSFTAVYGMKATSYANGGSHVVESWLVTPVISVKKAVQPALNFDQAINYGPTDLKERQAQMTVLVSTNYTGDVTTCDWKEIPYNEKDSEGNELYPTNNSWTFVNTGDMDLSQYVGQDIVLGFRYKTKEGQSCATWEIKNLLVHEAE